MHAVLDRVKAFTDKVRAGTWLGYSGKPITDIVNIGIGGSDLGPKMAVLALRSYAHPRLNMHFVSNVDGHDMDAVLANLNHDTTLFIVASIVASICATWPGVDEIRRAAVACPILPPSFSSTWRA